MELSPFTSKVRDTHLDLSNTNHPLHYTSKRDSLRNERPLAAAELRIEAMLAKRKGKSLEHFNPETRRLTSFVFLKLEKGTVHLEAFLPARSNIRASSLVVTSQPQCNSILLCANTDNCPTYFVTIQVECFPDNG